MQYLEGLLAVEPTNKQVLELKQKLDMKLRNDALKAVGIGASVAVGVGAVLVGVIAALAKK